MKLKIFLVLAYLLMFFGNIFAQSFNIGHTSQVFYDSTRNRDIETEIYYPADNLGENVPVASGNFPVIVFGHGFLMSWESYQNFWTELVPYGYVICFPRTEMSIIPNHEAFGLDLNFIATQMQNENDESSSLFFNSLTPKTGLMGHSMGGGATFIAGQNNTTISTLVSFAAAETTPSAISAVSDITVPTLIFSGDDDCIAPPNENQDLMYSNLSTDCKAHISIINGGHCYFADNNFNCNLGESFCNPTLDITREEQQSVTFDFLKLWLDYSLYENQNAYTTFNDSLQSSNRINFLQSCTTTDLQNISNPNELEMFPNPIIDNLNIVTSMNNIGGRLIVYNLMGEKVYQNLIHEKEFQINLSYLPNGPYFIMFYNNSFEYSSTFIKVGNN
jgi:dienelactone hydrolase